MCVCHFSVVHSSLDAESRYGAYIYVWRMFVIYEFNDRARARLHTHIVQMGGNNNNNNGLARGSRIHNRFRMNVCLYSVSLSRSSPRHTHTQTQSGHPYAHLHRIYLFDMHICSFFHSPQPSFRTIPTYLTEFILVIRSECEIDGGISTFISLILLQLVSIHPVCI